MESSQNIIYLRTYRDSVETLSEKERLLIVGEKKFNCRDKAEVWLMTCHPVIGVAPATLLIDNVGYAVILDMLENENPRWEVPAVNDDSCFDTAYTEDERWCYE